MPQGSRPAFSGSSSKAHAGFLSITIFRRSASCFFQGQFSRNRRVAEVAGPPPDSGNSDSSIPRGSRLGTCPLGVRLPDSRRDFPVAMSNETTESLEADRGRLYVFAVAAKY